MNFNQFKTDAIKTESRPEQLHINPSIFMASIAMAAEAGELVDFYKKKAFYDKPVDPSAIRLSLLKMMSHIEFLAANIDNIDNQDSPQIDIVDATGETVGAVTHEIIPTRLAHAFMGAVTESAELCSALIDSMGSKKPVDAVNISEEYGDLDWYKAIAFDELGLSEEASREAVIAKLKKRYGHKFTSEAAINRDLEGERAVLEEKTGA